jgi:hypothetical protein
MNKKFVYQVGNNKKGSNKSYAYEINQYMFVCMFLISIL